MGDELVIGSVGNRAFVAKEPIPQVGHSFLTTEHGSRLTTENGENITVAVDPDLDELTRHLEAGGAVLTGNPADRARRTIVLEQISELQKEIDRRRPEHGGIGHNNPPTEPEEELPAPEVLEVVEASVAIIGEQLAADEPDALEVARAGLRLRSVGRWFAGKGDIFADEFVKAFGKSLGESAGKAVALAALLMSVITALSDWLQAVIWPFFGG